MSYNTDPMGKALDDHITGHWGEDNVQPEFNLSEKGKQVFKHGEYLYLQSDVKEFIRLLKEECRIYKLSQDIEISIDKLAGEELIK